MKTKNLFFRSFTIILVIVFIMIPLSNINSHTYTLGVSNDYQFLICPLDSDFLQGYEFIELENY